MNIINSATAQIKALLLASGASQGLDLIHVAGRNFLDLLKIGITATEGAFSGVLLALQTTRAASDEFQVIEFKSAAGAVSTFYVRGDGKIYTRGDIEALGDIACNAITGDGSGLTGLQSVNVSGSRFVGDLDTALTGTVAITNASATVTGTGTAFDTELAEGDAIKIEAEIFTVSAIASATSLTLDSNYAGSTDSGLTAYRDDELLSIESGDAVQHLKVDKNGDLYINGVKHIKPLQETTTVNFDDSMSAADIQALIDAQPRNLNGFKLTFQFADGSYTLNDKIIFSGFENGIVKVWGNASESTLATTKSVNLTFTYSAAACVQFSHCSAEVSFDYIKLTSNTSDCLMFTNCTAFYARAGYYTKTTGTPNGIVAIMSRGYVADTYFNGLGYAISAEQSSNLVSHNTAKTSVFPNYGLHASYGSEIAKSGSQVLGSTADELIANGGLVR